MYALILAMDAWIHRMSNDLRLVVCRGLAAGKVLRWKNPRFHMFMDGSTGARIEEEDLANVTVTDA